MLPLVENLRGEECKAERDRLIALLEELRAELREAEKAIEQRRIDCFIASQRHTPRPKEMRAVRARLQKATVERDSLAAAIAEADQRAGAIAERLYILYRPISRVHIVGSEHPRIRDLTW